MKNRELKFKSLLMPKWKFYLYEKYITIKRKLKGIHEKFKEYEYESRWVYFKPSYHSFSISWTEPDYDESRAHLNISLGFFLLIYTSQKLKDYDKDNYDYHQGEREYGIKIHNDNFWIYRGLKHKAFEFPYTYRFIRHSVLKKDGEWEHDYSKLGRRVCKKSQEPHFDEMKDGSVKKHYRKDFWDDKWKDILFTETHDFIYVLNSGKKQYRKATIKVEEREWRRAFLVWIPYKNLVNRVIDISFDEEIGEKSGSYKGGVTGTGYKMLPNETPLECLRRFERNYKC